MIFRSPPPERDFNIQRNHVTRDERLSYRARGILNDLLSRPDNWRIDAEQIARHGREGRDAVRAALRELETAGYLKRIRVRDETTNRMSTISVLYDVPQNTEDWKADGWKPNFGKPVVGRPADGNSGPLTTTVTNNGVEDLGAKDQYQELLARLESGAGSALRADRAHEDPPRPKRPKRKRKPLTPEERTASWRRFRDMDLGDLDADEDIRGAAFVELEEQHGAYEPDKWAAAMIDEGTWDSFCASYDLGNNITVSWNRNKGQGAA
jgi:hypothetical protein